MNEYLRLFTKIKVHSLTLILILFSLLSAHFVEISCMFFIVFVHEMGHAFMAKRFNWNIHQITILPFGGQLETDVFGCKSSKEEFWVVMAGPLQHLFMFIGAFVLHQIQLIPDWVYSFFQKFNLIILFSNLYPALPLDGGRLLFLLFTKIWPFEKAHRMIVILSAIFAGCFILSILIVSPTHLNSWMFSLFIAFSIVREWRQRVYLHMRFLLSKNTQEPVSKTIIVTEDERLIHVARKFFKNRKNHIVVKKGQDVIGSVTEEAVIKHCFMDKQPFEKIGNLV